MKGEHNRSSIQIHASRSISVYQRYQRSSQIVVHGKAIPSSKNSQLITRRREQMGDVVFVKGPNTKRPLPQPSSELDPLNNKKISRPRYELCLTGDGGQDQQNYAATRSQRFATAFQTFQTVFYSLIVVACVVGLIVWGFIASSRRREEIRAGSDE